MKVYLPLKRQGGIYVADTDEVDFSEWRDANYVEFFEDELTEHHRKELATVSIDGTEFRSCEVFIPLNEVADHSFVAVDEEHLPLSFEQASADSSKSLPNQDWVDNWISKSRRSENYFHNFYIDLSTKYIAPKVVWDDEVHTLLSHPDSARRGSRVLLVGQPGAGKTSFARYMTQLYLRDCTHLHKGSNAPVVFYFQLREFAFRSNEFQSWLSNEEQKVGHSFVAEKNQKGKSVFVFDGLDELNVSDRDRFTIWLSNFIDARPSHSTIVTSRELTSLSSGIWTTFRRAKILPFDRSQVDEYCNLVVGDRNRARRFVGVLESNPDLQEFLRNPFSLSLALGMFMLRGALPFNIGVLCKELVTQLIEKWDSRRGISRVSQVSIESINSTLGRLAYRLQSNSDFQFVPENLDDLLPVEVEKIGALAVLQDLSERTGILTEIRPGTWSFSHRYFQDFFCANYLVERASGLGRELNEHGRDAGWVDVWRQVGQLCQDPEFFALSQSRDASDAIKSIDRMVSSLLTHDGLSKTELRKIVEGLTAEISQERSMLPELTYTEFGAEFECRSMDSASIEILANTITHLNYLKGSAAGYSLLGCLDEISSNDFADLVKKILKTKTDFVPRVGISELQIYFNADANSLGHYQS